LGATENAEFNAKVQQNLGLDFVTKQHKSLQKLQPAWCDMLTRVNFPTFAMADPRYGGLIQIDFVVYTFFAKYVIL